MTFILLLFAIIFVLAPLADAYAKRLKQPSEVAGIKPADLARLREEVETLAAQVNRLQDEQSFMLQLLSEHPRRGELGPSRTAPDEAGQAEPRRRPRG